MAVKRDKSSPWEFLWYALYAFAGLGLELVLMGGVEPALFGGTPPSRYTAAHTLLHWGMTMACWGLTAALLVRQAEKKLGFSLLEARPVPRKGGGARHWAGRPVHPAERAGLGDSEGDRRVSEEGAPPVRRPVSLLRL